MSLLVRRPLTGAEALRAAIPLLRGAGIEDAARDARALLADAMGLGADRLTLHLQDDLPPLAEARFQSHIAARARRQPVAQILAQVFGACAELFRRDDVKHGQCRCHGQRVGRIGATQATRCRRIHYLGAATYRR